MKTIDLSNTTSSYSNDPIQLLEVITRDIPWRDISWRNRRGEISLEKEDQATIPIG